MWWYIDGLSDDGRHAITLIAFIGSVFSPYYAWRGRRDPLDHCAINVALYGASGPRWTMTERGKRDLARDEQSLSVGPSSLHWIGDTLEIALDEIGAPIPRRVRGTIRITPSAFTGRSFMLDLRNRHLWQPIAPRARIEVMLDRPSLQWSGTGYLDSNFGAESLEAGFKAWTWSRAHLPKDAVVLYDTVRRDGSVASLALRFAPNGALQIVESPPSVRLSSTGWCIGRDSRADTGQKIDIRTLQDTPFYARSQIETTLYGEHAVGFHESLALDRFASPIVRSMLPFRMPRRFF